MSTLLCVKDGRTVRPSITGFVLRPGTAGEDTVGKWGWVCMRELVSCLNSLPGVENADRFTLEGNDVFRRFGHLAERGVITGTRFTYVLHKKPHEIESFSGSFHLFVDEEALPDHSEQGGINVFVPALWANNVIDLVKQGIRIVITNLGFVMGVDSRGAEFRLKARGKGRGQEWRALS